MDWYRADAVTLNHASTIGFSAHLSDILLDFPRAAQVATTSSDDLTYVCSQAICQEMLMKMCSLCMQTEEGSSNFYKGIKNA